MFEVSFKPHVGKKNVKGFGEIEVDLKQKFVYATHPQTGNRMHVGFIGTQENAPFNSIVNLGESINDQLFNDVIAAAKRAGLKPREKQVASPVAIPQTDESE